MNASDIIEDAIKHAAKRPLKLAKVYENYVYQLKQTMKNIEQQIHLMNRSSLLHFHQFQSSFALAFEPFESAYASLQHLGQRVCVWDILWLAFSPH